MTGLIDLTGPVVNTCLSWFSRLKLPQTSGKLRLPGLDAPVEVYRDRWGVPHIYGQQTSDVLFAQGFVHAQDRLWQMEFNRRLVAGRLAEILGEVAVPLDRWMRILGLRRAAAGDLDLLDAQERELFDAYAAGVCAFLEQGALPLEFTLLRYRPEPWTALDTLGWGKMMAWNLSVNWETELLRAQLIARLGPEKAAELEPGYPERCPTILPVGCDYAGISAEVGRTAQQLAGAARRFTGPGAADGLGSNNWVVSGARTASGAPLLANDMHLMMGIPAIWYENHLVSDDLNVTGVSFPGILGVVAGHNGQVAWGFTNGFPDVQDLYLERLRRTEDGRVQAEYQGEWLDATVLHEQIRVKGGQPVTEEVVITRHGPVINSLAAGLCGEQPLALRWTALEPGRLFAALFNMNRAGNCLEFREALRDWTVPTQNTVYADTQGNIGYSYPGRIPIRAKGDGSVPVPGWTGEYEWSGYIPYEELPHLYNPEEGFIATANNQVNADDYPYFLSRDYIRGDRAERITELLKANRRVDLAYIQRMHFDLVSTTARHIAGYLGQLRVDDPELAQAAAMVKDWDGELGAESPAAAVYQVFVRALIRRILAPHLGELADSYLGKGPTPVLSEHSLFGERAMEWLQAVCAQPQAHWFDQGQGENRDDQMRQALGEAVGYLKEKLGPRMEDWSWGQLHRLSYSHVLGQVRPLERLFNRGPYPLGGDFSTIWATGSSYVDFDHETVIGPPFRFIADLGDLRNSLGLLAPGQSGQPGSPHYDDQVQAWFEGEYHPMLFEKEEVVKEAVARLELRPG